MRNPWIVLPMAILAACSVNSPKETEARAATPRMEVTYSKSGTEEGHPEPEMTDHCARIRLSDKEVYKTLESVKNQRYIHYPK